MTRSTGLQAVACMALLVAACPVLAQEPVLRANQVTEAALEDALVVEQPESATGKSRGIRPSVRPATAKPAGPGKASLLITFMTNSAELTPEAKQTLDTVSKALQGDKLAGFDFAVEGHADPRGGADRNMELSRLRAESVVSYLVKERGVLAERLAAVGKGATELADPGRPDAPENRRVTIVTRRN